MSLETAYPFDLFINGAWTKSSSSNRITVENPSTGQRIADVADARVEDGLKAVDAADNAAQAWAMTPPRQRSEILRRCFDLMQRDSEKLARLISLENGKALRDARGEVAYAAEFFRWFSEQAVRNFGELALAPSGSNQIMVKYQPIGVCLLITPWNFPAAMATRKMAPALAAGCTCVLKPATETPLTAYAIAALMGWSMLSPPQPPQPLSTRSLMTAACARFPSPDQPRLAVCCCARRRIRLFPARWNWAAMRPLSSLMMPILTAPLRAR
jgi:succinate-semialdehyde dehydrogenase / glutarate-semialdehyde dehydrogenase